MSYEAEFVTKAVDAVNNRGEKTIKAVANELDVALATLNNWVRAANGGKTAKKAAPAKRAYTRKPKVAVLANPEVDLNSLPENVRNLVSSLLLENFNLRSKVS